MGKNPNDGGKVPKGQEENPVLPSQVPMHVKGGTHLRYSPFTGFVMPLNFLDACPAVLPFGVDEAELEHLDRINKAAGDKCGAKSDFSLDDVAKRILKEETSFDLSEYNLHVSASGARGAIIKILERIVLRERPFVAYSMPNWIFEKVMISKVPGAVGLPFMATDAEEFTRGFEQIASPNIAALIVVDPANPLGYKLTGAHVKRIEAAARKYHTTVIFDDVFRGMQEKGNRHSASEYSHESVIVESTSKRFTSRGLGVTWTLVPKYLVLPGDPIQCDGCSSNAAMVANALYETGHDTKVSRFIAQNSAAFVRGFRSECDSGKFMQAFSGMPIMTYHFEPSANLNSMLLDHEARPAVGITSGFEWISHVKNFQAGERGIVHAASYVRICPTKEEPDTSFYGGKMLGSVVNKMLEKK